MNKELKDFTLSELLDVCLCYKGHNQCDSCPFRRIFFNQNFICILLNTHRLHFVVKDEFNLDLFDKLIPLDVINDNSLRLVLVRNGFVSLNQFVSMSKSDLLKMRGFGIVKYNLLVQYLQKYFNYKEI